MLYPTIAPRKFNNKGYGLYTREKIPAGSIVWVPCKNCISIKSSYLKDMSIEEIQFIEDKAYYMENGDLLMPCSISRYMNHSCDANILEYGLDFGIAIRDIAPDEEICSDYRFAVNDKPRIMDCYCNSPNCIGKVSPEMGKSKELLDFWIHLIRPILGKIKSVNQLLHDVCLDCSSIYKDILEDNFSYLESRASILAPKYLVHLSSKTLYKEMIKQETVPV